MSVIMNRAARLVLLAALMSVSDIASAQMDMYGAHFPKPGGEDVYKGICQGCHMPDAMGATGAGAYPRLAGNTKLVAGAYPVTMVLFGRKAMPPFGVFLDDTQVANVVNYVRSHFGNSYSDAVTAADVAKIRGTEKTDEAGNVVKHPG